MPSKTIKSALLTCCLFSIHAAQAQVYIINTQTLDPEQLGTGGGHSLSDVKANRAVQLEYYHYSERLTIEDIARADGMSLMSI